MHAVLHMDSFGQIMHHMEHNQSTCGHLLLVMLGGYTFMDTDNVQAHILIMKVLSEGFKELLLFYKCHCSAIGRYSEQ